MFLIDPDFVVRYAHTGSSGNMDALVSMFRSFSRMVDRPVEETPTISDELVAKVAGKFLADQDPSLTTDPKIPTRTSFTPEIAKIHDRVFRKVYNADAPAAEKWNDDARKCIDLVVPEIIYLRKTTILIPRRRPRRG
ncbi:MAG: hypothetical protein U1D30_11100 [Planctomycetota bacterium]